MKTYLIRLLLALLNSRWLNQSPCRYEYAGNVDAFSRNFLASSEQQQPGITVKQVLDEADMYKACPINKNGLTVIDGDEIREATVWDRHELNLALSPSHQNKA